MGLGGVAQRNGEVHGHHHEDREDEDPAHHARLDPGRDEEPGDEQPDERANEQLPGVSDEEVVEESAE
jgi:hypothetical protein